MSFKSIILPRGDPRGPRAQHCAKQGGERTRSGAASVEARNRRANMRRNRRRPGTAAAAQTFALAIPPLTPALRRLPLAQGTSTVLLSPSHKVKGSIVEGKTEVQRALQIELCAFLMPAPRKKTRQKNKSAPPSCRRQEWRRRPPSPRTSRRRRKRPRRPTERKKVGREEGRRREQKKQRKESGMPLS